MEQTTVCVFVCYVQSWKDKYVCSGTRRRIEMVAVGQCPKITHLGLQSLGMTEDYVAWFRKLFVPHAQKEMFTCVPDLLNFARQILPFVAKGPCFVVIRHTRECRRTETLGSSAIFLYHGNHGVPGSTSARMLRCGRTRRRYCFAMVSRTTNPDLEKTHGIKALSLLSHPRCSSPTD